jgi:hypothetical protein
MEAVLVVERVRTLLFLMDSNSVDLLFALEANKDSKEDSGRSSEHEGIGHGNERGGVMFHNWLTLENAFTG